MKAKTCFSILSPSLQQPGFQVAVDLFVNLLGERDRDIRPGIVRQVEQRN
jgi:hypothetical protein